MVAADVANAAPSSSSVWFTPGNGARLAVRDWRLPPGRARGMVLIVHGLGEHSGRHERLVSQLVDAGFAVRALPGDLREDAINVLSRTVSGMLGDLTAMMAETGEP